MKVLVNTSSFPNDNNLISGNFILDQINNLSRLYNNVKFIVCTPGPTIELDNRNIGIYNFRYFFLKKYENIGVKSFVDLIYESKLNYLVIVLFSITQFIKMLQISLKEKPDLIYSHWFLPQGIISYLIFKILKIPYKITIHSTDLKIFTHNFGKIGEKIAQVVLTSSSGISVTSKKIFESVNEVLSKDQIEKLNIIISPMGLDTVSIDTTIKDATILKKIDTNKKYILYIGRLVEKKGLDLLIKCFAEITKKYDYNLIIAGFGNLEKTLREHVRLLEIDSRVVFTGMVNLPEKKALLDSSDFLIVPSNTVSEGLVSEGMPVTILEGLYFGKITVASDLTNCQEIIQNGENGFIFKGNNEQNLLNTLDLILKMSTEDLEKIKLNAKNSSKLYDSEGSGTRYYEFLKL